MPFTHYQSLNNSLNHTVIPTVISLVVIQISNRTLSVKRSEWSSVGFDQRMLFFYHVYTQIQTTNISKKLPPPNFPVGLWK